MQYTVTPTHESTAPRRAAVNALAIVGFIALVVFGIALAIYASKFVPSAISRIGHGLGLAATNGDDGLVVVPETPIDYNWEATTTPATPAPVVTPTPTPTTPKPATNPSNQIIGYHTVTTDYPTPGSVKVPTSGSADLHGDPNLTTRITGVGSVDSKGNNFDKDDTIDTKDRLAVAFTVTNTGTNKSGAFKVQVILPTDSDRTFDYTSKSQESLNPGDKIDFLVYLDKGDTRRGDNQKITVEADPKDDVDESNESDNRDTAEIDID